MDTQPSSHAIIAPTLWCLVTVGAFIGLAPPTYAQEGLYFEEIPDLKLYSTAARNLGGPDEEGCTLTRAGLFGLLRPNDTDNGPEWGIHTDLGLGWRAAPRLLFQARSELSALQPNGDPQLRGFHRARVWFTVIEADEAALNIEAHYHLLHGASEWTMALPPRDIGPAAFLDERVAFTLWPSSAAQDDNIVAMPLTYRYRQVNYRRAPAAPVTGLHTHQVSTALSLLPPADEFLAGRLDMVSLSLSETRFARNASQPQNNRIRTSLTEANSATSPTGDTSPIRQLDLKLLNLENLVYDGGTILGNLGFFLGGSWLWIDPDADLATWTVGGEFAVMIDDDIIGDIGVGASRGATHTPDGLDLLETTRVEVDTELTIEDLRWARVEFAAILQHFGQPLTQPDSDQPEPQVFAIIRSGWRFELGPGRLGVFHQARFAPEPGDAQWHPLHAQGRWAHEIGLWLDLGTPSPSLKNADHQPRPSIESASP